MKIREINAASDGSDFSEVNSIEELKKLFETTPDKEIDDVIFHHKGYDSTSKWNIYEVKVSYKGDEGYWTAAFSDSKEF